MQRIPMDNYKQMSKEAARRIYTAIQTQPSLVLGIATGGTPAGTYLELVHVVRQRNLNLSQIKTVNLDEYVGLSQQHDQSYWKYTEKYLYNPLHLSPSQALIPNGAASDLTQECIRYEKDIEAIGGVDLQILGVGRNGHIGFNEPGTPPASKTHVVRLTTDTREANARFFSSMEDVPTQAITVGISTIMKSKAILLLASGREKADAVGAFVGGQIDGQWPVTFLNKHKNVTLLVTKDALYR